MAEDAGAIRVNWAPVLTLWAAVAAERLGFDRATKPTSHAVASPQQLVAADQRRL